jgi:hypothetical protein
MIDYFLYTDVQLRWIAAPTLLPLLSTHLVVTIHNLLLANILR